MRGRSLLALAIFLALFLTGTLGTLLSGESEARFERTPSPTSEPTRSTSPFATPVFRTFGAIADAFIDGRNPNRNYGGSDVLVVGGDPANGTAFRGLALFNLTGIPSTAIVQNATLRAWVVQGAAGPTLDVHRLRAPWVEGTGTEFGFRQPLTITETAGVPRVREPVDIDLAIPVPLSTFVPADFRVYDEFDQEVPSQVYGARYSGSNVTRVHVVFGATVGPLASRQYSLYYGNMIPTVPSFRTKAFGNLLWNFSAGTAYTSLAAADLTGDGDLEVVLGSSDNNVYVIRWDGTLLWNYTAPDVVDYFATPVDVDGDGALEVVFATSGTVDYKIYALSANGTTLEWSTGASPTRAVYGPIAISDIDGDGIKELFAGSQDRGLYAFNGNDGTVRWQYGLTGGRLGYAPSVGNLTEGPQPEIVYTTSMGQYYVLRADGTAVPYSPVQPGSNSAFAVPSLGDLQGDGYLDVVAGDTAVNGNQFAFNGTNGITLWSSATTSDQWGGQVLVDFEDDGWLETAFSMTRQNSLGLLDANGSLLWSFPTGGAIWGAPAAADVDLDGIEDLLIGSFDNSLYVVNYTGAMLAQFPAPDWVSAAPVVADLDGDGTMEIVFASRTQTFAYSTGSLGHDFRTGWYNYNLTGRFLDGNSPDGAPLLNASVGALEILGGSGVTWQTRDGNASWVVPGADFNATVVASAPVSGPGSPLTWNITDLVQRWTNGSLPNVGVLLKVRDEAVGGLTSLSTREGLPGLAATLEVLFLENVDPQIDPTVPDQQAFEDGDLWNLALAGFAVDPDTPLSGLRWDLAGANASLYDYTGGNQTGNHILSFQPKPNAFGDNLVTLFLFDDTGNYATQPLWINITSVNDPPTFADFTPDTLYVKRGVPYTFDFGPHISDIDTPRTQLVLRTNRPQYTTVTGFRVTFNYPATFADPWDFIVLTVDDGELSTSHSIAVGVTDDTPPLLIVPLPDLTIREGETRRGVFDLDDYFLDPDEDVLFFTYGFTHLNVTITANHSVDVEAFDEWNGVESVTFRAQDPTGAIAEDTILVEVLPVNDPPVIGYLPPFVVHFNETYVFDLSPHVSDPDNDLSDIRIRTNQPLYISVDGMMLSMLFPETIGPLVAPYTLPLTIFANDSIDEDFVSTTVTVGYDYPPRLRAGFELPDQVLFEDTPLLGAFDLDDYFWDPDSATIFYTSGQVNIEVTIQLNHTVDFVPKVADWFGAERVTFRATDESGAYAEDTIKITVRPVNDAPRIREIPILVSDTSVFFFSLADYVWDVENDTLTVRTNKPTYVRVEGLILLFNYPAGVREDALNVTVSDWELASTVTLQIRITGPDLLLTILPWIVAIGGSALVIFSMRFFRSSVEHVFLIYAGGIPLVHLSRTLTSDKDPDLIASMFSAIQSFVNESFHSMGVGELKSIELADHHMAVARGQYVVLIVLYSGRQSGRMERRVNEVVMDIEKRFEPVLSDWNGDVDRLVGVKRLLEQLWGAKETGHVLDTFQPSTAATRAAPPSEERGRGP